MKRLRRQRKDQEPKPQFMEIQYAEEPPILEQCGTCKHAILEYFDPQEICEHRIEVKATRIECQEGNNCWKEGECPDYRPGHPNLRMGIPIAAN